MKVIKDMRSNIYKTIGDTKRKMSNVHDRISLKKSITKQEMEIDEQFYKLGKLIYKNYKKEQNLNNNLEIDELLVKIESLESKVKFDKDVSDSVKTKYKIRRISSKLKNKANRVIEVEIED